MNAAIYNISKISINDSTIVIIVIIIIVCLINTRLIGPFWRVYHAAEVSGLTAAGSNILCHETEWL